MNHFFTKSTVSLMLSIVATGALLNLANKGTFGSTVRKASKFVTEGFGAGAIN